jgi:hypothetical protein
MYYRDHVRGKYGTYNEYIERLRRYIERERRYYVVDERKNAILLLDPSKITSRWYTWNFRSPCQPSKWGPTDHNEYVDIPDISPSSPEDTGGNDAILLDPATDRPIADTDDHSRSLRTLQMVGVRRVHERGMGKNTSIFQDWNNIDGEIFMELIVLRYTGLIEWGQMLVVCRLWYEYIKPMLGYYIPMLQRHVKLVSTSTDNDINKVHDFILVHQSDNATAPLFQHDSDMWMDSAVITKFVVGYECIDCKIRYVWISTWGRRCYACECRIVVDQKAMVVRNMVCYYYNYHCWRWPQYYRQLYEPETRKQNSSRPSLHAQFNRNTRSTIDLVNVNISPEHESGHLRNKLVYTMDWEHKNSKLIDYYFTPISNDGAIHNGMEYRLDEYVIPKEHLKRVPRCPYTLSLRNHEIIDGDCVDSDTFCTSKMCNCERRHAIGVRKAFRNKYAFYGYPLYGRPEEYIARRFDNRFICDYIADHISMEDVEWLEFCYRSESLSTMALHIFPAHTAARDEDMRQHEDICEEECDSDALKIYYDNNIDYYGNAKRVESGDGVIHIVPNKPPRYTIDIFGLDKKPSSKRRRVEASSAIAYIRFPTNDSKKFLTVNRWCMNSADMSMYLQSKRFKLKDAIIDKK